MNIKKLTVSVFLILLSVMIFAQKTDPYAPDFRKPKAIKGMKLVWNDEFNKNGKPDTAFWRYERGFVRNQELQWYQENNAVCTNGVLLIEGRREQVKNPDYNPGSTRWNTAREFAEYTSSSIQTRKKKQWQFGTFIIRARIDTSMGSWPAIWTLGISGGDPSGTEFPVTYEVDYVRVYQSKGK